MLRTVQSLPLAGLLTLGFDPDRFQTEPPVCYRASWQLPGPDSHRQATTSTNTKITYTRSPPVPLGARNTGANGKAERFNRTLLTEWAYTRAWTSNPSRARGLDTFLDFYNTRRGHSALGGRPPMSRLAA